MKKSSVSREGVCILRFCVKPWKGESEPNIKYCLGRQDDVVQKFTQYRTLDTLDGEPMEFEWNIFQDSPHCSSAKNSQSSCQNWAYNQKISLDGLSSCPMFNDISWGSQDNEKECESSAQLGSIYLKKISRKMVVPRTWIRKKLVESRLMFTWKILQDLRQRLSFEKFRIKCDVLSLSTMVPWPKRTLHRLQAQRSLHYRGVCRVHPGVLKRTVVPEDFDYDDITIGQTLLNACRRRADHSEEEGLSSCLSSSSMSHDRTGKPVVCRDTSHKHGQEIQGRNSQREQIGFSWSDKESRFSLTVKVRFENTNSRLIMTEEVFKSWMKWSSLKKKKFVVLIKETNDFDEINNFFMNSYWSKTGIYVKLMIKASVKWKNWSDFQGSTFRHNLRGENWSKIKILPWIHWQDSGISEWNLLYERYERFSRCWISTQWTFPRCKSSCVFSTSSRSWWKASRSLGMPSCKMGEQIRIFLERQKEQILVVCQANFKKREFQADCDRKSI